MTGRFRAQCQIVPRFEKRNDSRVTLSTKAVIAAVQTASRQVHMLYPSIISSAVQYFISGCFKTSAFRASVGIAATDKITNLEVQQLVRRLGAQVRIIAANVSISTPTATFTRTRARERVTGKLPSWDRRVAVVTQWGRWLHRLVRPLGRTGLRPG